MDKPEWWTSDYWSTPIEVMLWAEERFGRFTLDPCCRPETAKCSRYFTEEHDGLVQPWQGRVFLNPPYSNPTPWLKKALEEIAHGRATEVVALLPVRTDTRWFHNLVWNRSELVFYKGRIKWIGWQGTPIPSPKNPSMFAVYR